jgi:hypothetical protein
MTKELSPNIDPRTASASDGCVRSDAPQDLNTCGDLDIRIDRNGDWYYCGSIIARKELVCLFSSALSRDSHGNYWLITPAEKGLIHVDDVPFLAVAMTVSGKGRKQVLNFETNVGDTVTADRDHPITVVHNPETGESIPYITIRQRIDARIKHSVYYDLVALGTQKKVDHVPLFGVWSSGKFFSMGRLDESQ